MNPTTLFCTTFTLYLYTFVCIFFLFNFKCSQSILNERIFEKKLTPLDSSQLEVLLGIFHFLEFKFEF